MGVSGCGKSTVAEGISEALGLPFAEADRFHPESNIAKMSAGTPLTDADRRPWLADLAAWMAAQAREGQSTVMACSALRRSYRDILRSGPPQVQFVHLDGPSELISARMSARPDHFMPAALLQSQVATLEPLEPDEDGVVLDLRQDPDTLVDAAVRWLAAH
ncbi:gluconokinase [Phycicoccus endophyticus]|uniref:Gluconokinase n=2 Tax=Phycicoccus endophyticus TaxID=1690220 RepID=A0A7G9R636_9MICO|nr:gluconokinase [Phycicoccus endophyticus]QNN51061.1 gluconokinase [Phycicoccus endophyticus]